MSGRWLALLMLTGCGQLADGTYRGEKLFELSGTVYTDEGQEFRSEDLRVSLFWSRSSGAVEEQDIVLKTSFPAQYTLEIYAFPPEDALVAVPWDSGHDYAVGAPLAYLDEDGDHQWDPDVEPLMGGAPEVAVVFAAARTEDPETGPELESVREGFQRMWSDFAGAACGDVPMTDKIASLYPADGKPTDIVVGDWWEELEDWDCDGKVDWEEFCPEAQELEDWCNERQFDGTEWEACSDLCIKLDGKGD